MRLTRAAVVGAVAAVAMVLPAAQASAAPLAVPTPFGPVALPCYVMPMILIYPPPPPRVLCHTPWGDIQFTVPPGWV